ncbi:MAG TPA: PilT/PilU family type 4a pilus ATPase [Thermoanaerobaculia bacterium]|nr:PilT/PilU family type 4a pilus ATPase [Thermoanaerobaculia bacterium]
MATIDALLEHLTKVGGSDLHLNAGEPPKLRLRGVIQTIEDLGALSSAELEEVLREIAPAGRWRDLDTEGDVDFAYSLKGTGRFRTNVFREERGLAAVCRAIPDQVPDLETLGLPPAVLRCAELDRGLALVTGPTGSGKSTTLAAIVDHINRNRSLHIVTIEDPVEFVHANRRSIVSQREIGQDTGSFEEALRAALREDADVILVGELRDLETISLALTAAEMGSLVFGTLHTNSATSTIDRLVDVFPFDRQAHARASLGDTLVAVICQQLLPTVDGGGRAAAVEILFRARGLGNIIREGNTPMIRSIIQSGRRAGMQTLDESLDALVRAGKVSVEAARSRAADPSRVG